MTTQEQRILNTAVMALGRATGMQARVQTARVGRNRAAKAVLGVKIDRRTHRFGAEVKTVDRFETPAMLKAKGAVLQAPPLLVAPYITRQVAERCRQLRLPFIDTAGNAYLEAPGLLVYVVGQPRPVELRRNKYRALKPAGLKLILLCCAVRNCLMKTTGKSRWRPEWGSGL